MEETAKELNFEEPAVEEPPTPPPAPSKRRGRPVGSKNKPKTPIPIDPEAVALRTRNAPKKDNGPDCIQSSLFCNVSPHPVKWKPNPNSTAKQKHSSSGV